MHVILALRSCEQSYSKHKIASNQVAVCGFKLIAAVMVIDKSVRPDR